MSYSYNIGVEWIGHKKKKQLTLFKRGPNTPSTLRHQRKKENELLRVKYLILFPD